MKVKKGNNNNGHTGTVVDKPVNCARLNIYFEWRLNIVILVKYYRVSNRYYINFIIYTRVSVIICTNPYRPNI